MQSNKPIIFFDIDYTLFDTDSFRRSGLTSYALYQGDLEALKELEKIADMGIFSQEIPSISQLKKLEKTGIRRYFPDKRIHLHADKLAEMEKMFETYRNRNRLILIDDKLAILDQAKKTMPEVITIWVNRGPHASQESRIEGFKPDLEVKSLINVVPFVQNLCAEFSLT